MLTMMMMPNCLLTRTAVKAERQKQGGLQARQARDLSPTPRSPTASLRRYYRQFLDYLIHIIIHSYSSFYPKATRVGDCEKLQQVTSRMATARSYKTTSMNIEQGRRGTEHRRQRFLAY